nr:glycosyl hydrolase family 65 protein [Massilia mucilaginosa]
MRVADGALRFAPTLPARWQHYQFQIHIHGARLAVRIDAAEARYTLVQGESLALSHCGERVSLTRAAPSVSVARPRQEQTA